jgi:hypothetical protein
MISVKIREFSLDPNLRFYAVCLGAIIFLALPFSYWNTDSLFFALINSLLTGTAASSFFIAYGFNKDFLYPYKYSLLRRRYLTERRTETTLDSFQSSTSKIKEYFLIFNHPEKISFIYYSSIIFCFIFFFFISFLLYIYKIRLYNHLPQNHMLKSIIVLFCFTMFFYAFGFILTFILKEILLYIITYKNRVAYPIITIDKIREFRETYKNNGLVNELNFDNIFINLIMIIRLGHLFSIGKGNIDLVRFWQAALLYLSLAAQILGNSFFTKRLKYFIRFLEENELEIFRQKQEEKQFEEPEKQTTWIEIKELKKFWQQKGFNTDEYSFLRYIPENWKSACKP